MRLTEINATEHRLQAVSKKVETREVADKSGCLMLMS